jgi:O-6-methylguanine DNA methyltransferase
LRKNRVATKGADSLCFSITLPGVCKAKIRPDGDDCEKENTMSLQIFDTFPNSTHTTGQGAQNPALQASTATVAAAGLDPSAIRGAILPETVSLAKAAQDADPALVHANHVSLRAVVPGRGPETLRYSFHLSPFGQVLIASGSEGVCHATFVRTHHSALQELAETFLGARLLQMDDPDHKRIMALFNGTRDYTGKINLHMPGTDFQHRVWNALLCIPRGTLATYGQIAAFIGQPQAARAVGTAIGANRAAFLIPCHRVVRRSGDIGGFMWGVERKTAMIATEIGAHRA